MTVNANAGEYKSRVGLDSLYVALVTQDTAAGYVAGTPEYLAPAATASQKVTSSQDTQYADDQPYDVMTSEGPTDVELEVTGLPLEMQALVLGKAFDATTGRMYDYGGSPPDVALAFRSMKSNGKYRYYWFMKGKFSPPDEETATRGEKPEPKTAKLNFKAIPSIYKFDIGSGVLKAVKRVVGDEDTLNFSGSTWFSQVQTPAVAAVSALAISVADPIDGAATVAVTKTITLTFNNALTADAIAHVVVVKADGTAVACTNSLDATKKILTVNPNASLDAASTYIVAIAVKDIYGQALNAAIDFGTA
ncbi:MAG: Ig-like domain-containing protein [Anaerolineaceae bacterium]|nr:Ig-like domain-containing protein [Anaerolineaceae bacterium]MDD5367511.1 Ig-like domain-containing protein [Anaerolineaceae bacterium]